MSYFLRSKNMYMFIKQYFFVFKFLKTQIVIHQKNEKKHRRNDYLYIFSNVFNLFNFIISCRDKISVRKKMIIFFFFLKIFLNLRGFKIYLKRRETKRIIFIFQSFIYSCTLNDFFSPL